jgi:DNA-binding CsgD family transcriptional regulator/PAS domain-containing protein
MMLEAECLSLLVADIYDSALDPSRWRGALRDVAAFVGGSAASLCSINVRRGSGESHYDSGLQPSFAQSYFEKYIKYDPTTVGQFVLNVEDVHSVTDFLTLEELVESRFYKEFLKPHGWLDRVGATLEKSTTTFAACVVFRTEEQGPADEGARTRMQLLVPHIRRAVHIGNVIDLEETKASSFAALFDSLADGVLLVDAHARIAFANTAARAMLAEGNILRDAGGKLSAIDSAADRALRSVFAAALGGDAEVGVEGVALPLLSRSDNQWLAHVLPLTSGEARRSAANEYSATTAVFVRNVHLETPSILKTVATLYRLTPREIRVLQALVEVGGVPAVADELGVSAATVRTHLKNLFEKTGMRRQADLVRLISGHQSPFAA